VSGIGPLTCYDFTYLIGAWLKKEPTEVYLHAGTRKGAQAVLGAQANRDRLPVSAFPEGLRRSLTAAQIEDVLCIYHGPLARIAVTAKLRRPANEPDAVYQRSIIRARDTQLSASTNK
jgi:uncharacterized membrane protein